MKKKHSLVIGGTRGIGRIIVKAFCKEGHKVSIIGLHPPYAKDKLLSNAHYWTTDIKNNDQITQTLDAIISKNGKINNIIFSQRYRGKEDTWKGELETSLSSTKTIIEYVKDSFDEKSWSSIVIISSVIGHFIAEESSLGYQVAKAGLNHLMRCFSILLANKRIRVNCVSPGTILKDESKNFYLKDPKINDLFKKINPFGCMGTAADIANVVVFLCSEKSTLINGQNIVVDGGLSLQWQESLSRKLFAESSMSRIGANVIHDG